MENGCIVGEVTPETLLKRNSFLTWRGGAVEDFELVIEYRRIELKRLAPKPSKPAR